MQRREALRTLAAAGTVSLAGCLGSTVTGTVATNETALTIEHEYTVRASGNGTKVLVETTATNETDELIDGPEPLLDATCRFLDGVGEQLHGSTRRIEPPLEPGWTRDMEFILGGTVDEAERYELLFRWADRE